MSIRNILVAFKGSASAETWLRHAAALAGETAHVTALVAHSDHETVNSNAPRVPARAREIIEGTRAKFDALADALDLGERVHFLQSTGRVDAMVSETARAFDLLVLGRTLLGCTRETAACLLVMGAYEHSTFREDFLGGATARVLKDIRIPVLLSH